MCPAQSTALCIKGIESNQPKRSAVPNRMPIINNITVYGMGIFLKNLLVFIPINKERIINNSGDMSNPLVESPPASNTTGHNEKIVKKDFFIFKLG